VPDHNVLFGASLGQWNGADAADAAGRIRLATQADRDGLDLFTVADHPYFGDKLDAYALTGFLLGQTERITGMVAVTNLPSRPAPVLARTLTSLSALLNGRRARRHRRVPRARRRTSPAGRGRAFRFGGARTRLR
jgi:alkanesulfonate monooxygenase SsuD/methylene tetrahydromethanopterin reductase-like flavin-dependent oxidoreductase (luciferase family)